jgi:hypothetical protein
MTLPKIRGLSGLVLLSWAVFAIPATTALGAGPIAFTGIASGLSLGALTNCPVGLCPGSDSCTCVPLSGTGKATNIGVVNFSTTVVLDGSLSVGNCDEALGTLKLTSKAKATNALVMDYVGTVCVANGSATSGFLLNATYFVDSALSTGKFANATGSGNVAGSEDANTGDILGNVNGTLVP